MPASAQVSAEIALQSDYRLRGYSLSDGEPVAAVSLGYDDPSGFYAGGSAIGVLRGDEPELLALQGSAGYAARLSADLSIDVGIARSQYYSGYGSTRNYHYTELYVGLSRRPVTGRVSFSPDYFRADTPTVYAEVETGFEIAPDWLVNAHVGTLHYLDQPPPTLPRRRYDWRLGGTRRLGPYGIHLELTGRLAKRPGGYTPAYPYPVYGAAPPKTNGAAVVASLTRSL